MSVWLRLGRRLALALVILATQGKIGATAENKATTWSVIPTIPTIPKIEIDGQQHRQSCAKNAEAPRQLV